MIRYIHWLNVLIMAEALIAQHLFARFLPRRPHWPVRAAAGAAVCLPAAYLLPVWEAGIPGTVVSGSLLYLAIFGLSVLAMWACYATDGWSLLFCCVAGYTVKQLASAIEAALLNSGLCLGLAPQRLAVYAVSRLAAYWGGCTMLSGPLRRGGVRINSRRLLLVSAGALLVDMVFGMADTALQMYTPRSDYHLVLQLYNTLACVLVLALQFSLLHGQRMQTEAQISRQLLREAQLQFESARGNIERINQKCHDLKHQIHSLHAGDRAIDSQALREIEQDLDIYDARLDTGNEALDVILNEKSLLCRQEGISLTCSVQGRQLCFMRAADLYALFGNALDNAIEAVLQLPEPEKRVIGLQLSRQGALLCLHVENYYTGTLDMADGIPQTQKPDKDLHGYGMRSMQMIAQQYGGQLHVSAENGVFHLHILLPLPKDSPQGPA